MAEPEPQMLVTHCHVDDDLAATSYTIDLAEVVRIIDDPQQPGAHRPIIISLLNAAIADRHPEVVGRKSTVLNLTADEFSDIKIQVIQNLLAWVKQKLDRAM